jgi:hypothetical protein
MEGRFKQRYNGTRITRTIMALAKQITQFRLRANGTNYDLNIQNMDFRWELERFTDESIALDGTVLNENVIAGKRLYVDVNYNQNIEPTTWDSMSDNIMDDFIYNGVGSVNFFPDASATSNNEVIGESGTVDTSVSKSITIDGTPITFYDVITITSHGLSNGERLYVATSDITNVTATDVYYVTKIDNDNFQLTSVIAGLAIDLSTDTNKSLALEEEAFIEMTVENLDELQSYKDTISSFKPSIRLKSKYRYVRIPSLFANV